MITSVPHWARSRPAICVTPGAVFHGPVSRELVRQWLSAGVVEGGRFTSTQEGVPQGGVISPLLLNVALHGMEAAAGVRYHVNGTRAGKTMDNCPAVIRYADDLLALCHTRQQAEQVKAQLAQWLALRGLVFNEDKRQLRLRVTPPRSAASSRGPVSRLTTPRGWFAAWPSASRAHPAHPMPTVGHRIG
jgi:hypothetical protein